MTRTDLIVIGGGPAGIAATVMGISLGMSVRLIERERTIGGKLHHIPALNNVPGGWTTGTDLVAGLAQDLDSAYDTGLLHHTVGTADSVAAHPDHAEVTLIDGEVHTAGAIIVATGVHSLTPADVSWVTAPIDFWADPLWRTTPQTLHGPTWVFGADRPLGTWLRAHPDVQHTLNVLCPAADDYKATEVAGDPRVNLVRCSHVTVTDPMKPGTGWTLTVKDRSGAETTYMAGTVLQNLGNRPAALQGLAQGDDGYCPPEQQPARLFTAGDLRSARFQRIVTAQGSGAEAALAHYYADALTRS